MINNNIIIKARLASNLDVDKFINYDEITYYLCDIIAYYYFDRLDVQLQGNYDDYELFDVGIEVELDQDTITVKNNIIILKKNYEKVPLISASNKLIEKIIEPIIWCIDEKSMEGRQLLLNMLLDKYRGKSIIPKDLLRQTKELDFTFKRLVDDAPEYKTVCLKDIVGTEHPDYSGYSWEDIFFKLKRTSTTLKTIVLSNSLETLHNNNFGSDKITFVQLDDEFYTSSGSHRTTISKIIGLESLSNCPVSVYKTDLQYKNSFEKIKNMGLNVKIRCELKNQYINDLTIRTNYEWEEFIIEVNSNYLHLYEIEEINVFIDFIESLNHKKVRKLKIKNYLSFMNNKWLELNKIEAFILKNINKIWELLTSSNRKNDYM